MKRFLLVTIILQLCLPLLKAQDRSAMIVIDIQSCFTDMMKEERSEALLAAVNSAIASQRPEEVIFIKANIKVLSISLKGIKVIQAENLDLDPRINIKKNDRIWMKDEGSAFSIPELNTYLDSLGIYHVKIAGMYAEKCVGASVRDAIERGYKVSLVEEAIACKKEKKREEVMAELEEEVCD